MKAKEVREMSQEELQNKLVDLKSELFQLRFSHKTKQLTSTSKLTQCKKDIARVLTELRGREIAAQK